MISKHIDIEVNIKIVRLPSYPVVTYTTRYRRRRGAGSAGTGGARTC